MLSAAWMWLCVFLCVEHPLCVRPCSGSWDSEMNKTDGPRHLGAQSPERRVNSKHKRNQANEQKACAGGVCSGGAHVACAQCR
jgi:hypothetical protein